MQTPEIAYSLRILRCLSDVVNSICRAGHVSLERIAEKWTPAETEATSDAHRPCRCCGRYRVTGFGVISERAPPTVLQLWSICCTSADLTCIGECKRVLARLSLLDHEHSQPHQELECKDSSNSPGTAQPFARRLSGCPQEVPISGQGGRSSWHVIRTVGCSASMTLSEKASPKKQLFSW
jgi:hypothetical protein